ncbi:LysE family translocator [Thalassospira sp.]|uniref:LysE family translocator n=1 Tax=Thalassospira sp. TaxID=1912094 RepID=UPI00273346EF|nr:LysE family translocator [Thalassospira sp.]MDP2697419.1 LysE family translocator [Thalassospira sp.]
MDWSWIGAVSLFAIAMSATPGPNNTMLTASGANYGLRRSVPHLSGVTMGVTAIMLAVAALGAQIPDDPHIRLVLQGAGAVYLFWLAWKIGSATPTIPNAETGQNPQGQARPQGQPLTFMQGALFQFVNPKLWAMVAGAVAAFGGAAQADHALAVALVLGLIFGFATFASTILWILIGVGVGRFLRDERALRIFNIGMAVLLVASMLPMLLG